MASGAHRQKRHAFRMLAIFTRGAVSAHIAVCGSNPLNNRDPTTAHIAPLYPAISNGRASHRPAPRRKAYPRRAQRPRACAPARSPSTQRPTPRPRPMRVRSTLRLLAFVALRGCAPAASIRAPRRRISSVAMITIGARVAASSAISMLAGGQRRAECSHKRCHSRAAATTIEASWRLRS